MKKWYRIGVCLVLTVCLLLLSACAGDNNPPASDLVYTGENIADQATKTGNQNSTESTEQTEGKSTNDPTEQTEGKSTNDPTEQTEGKSTNDPTGQTEENTNNDSTKETEESAVTLTHKVSFIRGGKSELVGRPDIGYGELLDYESCKAFFNRGITHNSLSYPESFFEDHSLLVMGVWGSSSSIMEVSEVKYKDGSVFCYLEYPTNGDILHNADMAYWYCLIEVDKVLPEGTRVMYYGESVTYDLDAYHEKQAQFNTQCVK